MFVDLNGLWVQVVVGAAIGGLVNGGFELIEQKKKGGDIDWKAVGKATCVGVVEGAVCSVAGPVAAGAAVSAIELGVSCTEDGRLFRCFIYPDISSKS